VQEVLQAIFLGAVQGLTEFLPVSSSGHLRLIEEALGWTEEFGLAYDTILHVATLLAVIIYFRHEFWAMITAAFSSDPAKAHDKKLAWLIVVATIPTGIIGLLGSDWFETAAMIWVGVAFLITSASLTAAEKLSVKHTHDAEQLGWGSAILVGIAQGIAIMPGISRSGATIAAGLGVGLDREQAARFSFLLAAPIILLAGGKQALDVAVGAATLPSPAAVIAGFITAAATGYLAIWGLLAWVREHTLYPFAVYTGLLGIVVIVWQLTS
jgi:undecaprenyl-diphosphatase